MIKLNPTKMKKEKNKKNNKWNIPQDACMKQVAIA